MRKNGGYLILIVLFLCLFVSGCSQSSFRLTECSDIINNQYVTLKMEGDNLKEEADICICNKAGKTIYTDASYKVQIWNDDCWYDIDDSAVSFTAELILINPEEEYTSHINWRKWIGKLPPGKYRIRKMFSFSENMDSIFLAAAEFEIE